jgi:integrase/recombinase XerC
VNTALAVQPTAHGISVRPPVTFDPHTLVEEWLAGRSPRTRRAYSEDLEDFRRFVGADTGTAAADALLAHGAGPANALALAYRSHLVERGLAANTVNRRLAALRSLVSLAQLVGRVEWTLRVRNVRVELRRETRGPNEAGIRALFAELDRRKGAKAARDRAIFRLLFDLGLRRFEVAGLDLAHLDLEGARVAVLRKGKRERVSLELAPPTVAALAAWVKVRGTASGPLFTAFRRAPGERLDVDGLYRMIRGLGAAAGVVGLRTHKLRHSSVTCARRLAAEKGIQIEDLRDFSGHANISTLQVYLDRERSRQGEITRLVAAAFA